MVTKSEPNRDAACMIQVEGQSYCIDPLEEMLQTVGKRWALLVIGILGNHPNTRFSEAKRTIPGISARALSNALAELQSKGLVSRQVDAQQSPPAVSYNLTPAGQAMRIAMVPLVRWAEDNSKFVPLAVD